MKFIKTSASSSSTDSKLENAWFIKLKRRKEAKYLTRVPNEFINDGFNIFGIEEIIPDFDLSLNAILDCEPSRDFIHEREVYYLIHQRYIFTRMGIEGILKKVLKGVYGTCPILGCKGAVMVPVGLYCKPNKSNTKLFCATCGNLFEPKNSLKNLDGCAWGTSFAHYLIMCYSKYFEKASGEKYLPRLFGFQISELDQPDEVQQGL